LTPVSHSSLLPDERFRTWFVAVAHKTLRCFRLTEGDRL
jgi:hypothetical protein